MRLKLVQIGNSQGIRIPKSFLQQCGMKDEVEVEMENETIIIKPVKTNPREKWDLAGRKMAENGDDQLIDAETPTQFDEEEWDWK